MTQRELSQIRCWKPNTGEIVTNGDTDFVCEKWSDCIVLRSKNTKEKYEYTYEQISDAMISRKIWFK
jgi:hypothetical protein